ncbi:MAG: hypothetical protein AABX04_05375 [Nanoarchaeota archaeon]
MRHGEIHHLHLRKRIHVQHQQYPHSKRPYRILDRMILILSVIFPLTTIPQIYNIWIEHDAAGVSLITWSLFLILSIPFLTYAIVHKIKPYIIMNCLWMIVYALVIIGTIIYA